MAVELELGMVFVGSILEIGDEIALHRNSVKTLISSLDQHFEFFIMQSLMLRQF